MDAELKAKWCEALRSGRYQQGTRMLRPSKTSFCCLGVLCDVIDPTKWRHVMPEWFYGEWAEMMPAHHALEKAGISHADSDCVVSKLANMNDSGFTFAEIANWIESNL